MTIADLSVLLKARELSPVELLEAYLQQIEQFHDQIQAFSAFFPEAALEHARVAEREIAAGHWKGPLHGIPMSVKDGFDVVGTESAWSSNLFAPPVSIDVRRYRPREDAAAVKRLRDAGAVILGKTVIRQAGEWSESPSERTLTVPRNPWNENYSVGGSSSGSAAGLAAGFFAATIGEDTGGSTRIPASYCGVTGLRPTQGFISRRGSFEFCWLMDMPGPMAWTAEDCAILMSVLAGHDPLDPLSAKVAPPDFRAKIGERIDGARACVLENLTDNANVSSEVNQAVHEAVRAIASSGVTVERRRVPILELSEPVFRVIADSAIAGVNQARLRASPREYSRAARLRALVGSMLPAALVTKAERARLVLRDVVLGLLKDFDFLLCPTTPVSAPLAVHSAKRIANKRDAMAYLCGVRLALSPFSMAGVPALSVPCGLSRNGLPLGLQIIGRPFGDASVLLLGHAYQKVAQRSTARPPMFLQRRDHPNPTPVHPRGQAKHSE